MTRYLLTLFPDRFRKLWEYVHKGTALLLETVAISNIMTGTLYGVIIIWFLIALN